MAKLRTRDRDQDRLIDAALEEPVKIGNPRIPPGKKLFRSITKGMCCLQCALERGVRKERSKEDFLERVGRNDGLTRPGAFKITSREEFFLSSEEGLLY